MAIKLRVQETKIRLKVGTGDTVSLKPSEGIPIYPNEYTGSVEITPTEQTQVLNTNNLMLRQNITVNPIPSNYGLITYNGSTITVS